ncbi:hypothetical protein SRHO_G00029480 [Serrasalmus rhombeus]
MHKSGYSCFTCRKLHGRTEHQQMADLPAERLQAAPPFTYVAVDIFGPWEVSSRCTRGGHAHSKWRRGSLVSLQPTDPQNIHLHKLK